MGIKIGTNKYKPMFGNSKIKSVWFGNNKVWEGKEAWLIKNYPTISGDTTYAVSFVSNGTRYTGFRVQQYGPHFYPVYYIYYINTGGDTRVYRRGPGSEYEWTDIAYRTIVITPPYDASFKTWLEANAVKQN